MAGVNSITAPGRTEESSKPVIGSSAASGSESSCSGSGSGSGLGSGSGTSFASSGSGAGSGSAEDSGGMFPAGGRFLFLKMPPLLMLPLGGVGIRLAVIWYDTTLYRRFFLSPPPLVFPIYFSFPFVPTRDRICEAGFPPSKYGVEFITDATGSRSLIMRVMPTMSVKQWQRIRVARSHGRPASASNT